MVLTPVTARRTTALPPSYGSAIQSPTAATQLAPVDSFESASSPSSAQPQPASSSSSELNILAQLVQVLAAVLATLLKVGGKQDAGGQPAVDGTSRSGGKKRGKKAQGTRGREQADGKDKASGRGPKWNPYYDEFVRAAKKAKVPASWASSPALKQLIDHESSWRVNADNPTSSAFGLFQFLDSTWKSYLPEVKYGTKSAYWQAVGGFRYIKARYGSPEKAWAFWQQHHWY
ncbi:MAG: hypothetical protein HYZ28_02060 [Myxococcales bacterium]|nr:hypothetical protein [Myxococcales bacterium]